MARTDEGLRNGGRSLRGEYRDSRALAGVTGLEATEISDGSDETKLFSVIVESRRDDESIGVRDVYEPLYGSGSSGSSCSPSMLGMATSAPDIDMSEVKDTSPSSDGEGGSWSSASSYMAKGVAPGGGEWWIVVMLECVSPCDAGSLCSWTLSERTIIMGHSTSSEVNFGLRTRALNCGVHLVDRCCCVVLLLTAARFSAGWMGNLG
jgi:hypothetical protein